MLLGNILMSILLSKGIDKEWEVLEDQIYNSKEKYHGNYSYGLLVTADLLRPLIVAVTEAALHMLSGNILGFLRLCEVSVFLSSFLCLRIIEAWLVAELADFLSSEKIKTESHIVYSFGRGIASGFLGFLHAIP